MATLGDCGHQQDKSYHAEASEGQRIPVQVLTINYLHFVMYEAIAYFLSSG